MKWFRRWPMAALSFAPFVVACGDELDPGSRVTDFRLIAVRADKPYAGPGERVEVTTLSHEPFARRVTWAWATCVRPDDTTVNGCLDKVVAEAKATGKSPFASIGVDRASFTTTIPADVLDGLDATAAASALVGIVTVACPGTIDVKDLAALKEGELPFRCVEANGSDLSFDRFAISVKRIYVRKAERNANPTFSTVTFDGQPWREDDIKEVGACKSDPVAAYASCKDPDEHELAVVVPPEVAEAGASESGAAFREDVVVQYYATEGLFEFDARTRESPSTKWTARSRSKGEELTFWFVVRENRGGVTWTTRRVRVR